MYLPIHSFPCALQCYWPYSLTSSLLLLACRAVRARPASPIIGRRLWAILLAPVRHDILCCCPSHHVKPSDTARSSGVRASVAQPAKATRLAPAPAPATPRGAHRNSFSIGGRCVPADMCASLPLFLIVSAVCAIRAIRAQAPAPVSLADALVLPSARQSGSISVVPWHPAVSWDARCSVASSVRCGQIQGRRWCSIVYRFVRSAITLARDIR